MALIKWDESLSVSIKEIDDQHKRLIKLINELHDAMAMGKGRTVAGKIINELVNYAESHFSTEERYFEKFKYPETVQHKAQHNAFVTRVEKFKKDYDTGKATLTLEIINFLSDWLRTHIKGTDKKYTKFFHDHGLH